MRGRRLGADARIGGEPGCRLPALMKARQILLKLPIGSGIPSVPPSGRCPACTPSRSRTPLGEIVTKGETRDKQPNSAMAPTAMDTCLETTSTSLCGS